MENYNPTARPQNDNTPLGNLPLRMTPQVRKRHNIQRDNSKLPLKLLIFAFIGLVFWGFIKRNPNINQPNASQAPSLEENQLLSNIKNLTENSGGSWGIYVYDLKNNHKFGINENMIFNAASINKIPILASIYYLANKDEVDLDEKISLQQQDIQDYGSGTIRYDPPGTVYSVKTLARLMIQKSDNTASYILGRQITGFDKIQNLVNQWGLTQTDMENDKTSLVDMANLLEKMYKNEVTSIALTTEMLGFMTESDFEDRIPALLPRNIKIYHKTGDAVGSLHDIGIIELKNHPYILGVFNADTSNDSKTKEIVAQISKMVFDFESKN